jgi:NTP pyrophosphatase (non-canonical NTP hydrolase)
MLNKELTEFIKAQTERVKKYYNCKDPKMFSLTATVKLNEELGELCQEILASTGMRRKDKASKHNKQTLSEEFADVLITCLILANSLDIDLEKVLREKIKSITKAYVGD